MARQGASQYKNAEFRESVQMAYLDAISRYSTNEEIASAMQETLRESYNEITVTAEGGTIKIGTGEGDPIDLSELTTPVDGGFSLDYNTGGNSGGNFSGNVAVTGVSIPESLVLAIDPENPTTVSSQLSATIQPNRATNKAVTWSSNAEGVATVNQNGLVTAVAVGSATITVTTTDGSFTDTCAVTVKNVDIVTTGISLDEDSISFTTSSVPQLLTATVSPNDATDQTVLWTSSNSSVATVDENGLVTPIGNGSATITATTTGGQQTSCSVTVDLQFLSQLISSSNYGQTITYSANGITDWKVFYNDGTNVYIIASDYLRSRKNTF